MDGGLVNSFTYFCLEILGNALLNYFCSVANKKFKFSWNIKNLRFSLLQLEYDCLHLFIEGIHVYYTNKFFSEVIMFARTP